MSTPVPDVFKIFSLDRYFVWSAEMREHYMQVGAKVSPTPSFFDNENANRAFMYLSYWYAGLYVVCEGWKDELKLSDPEIDALLKSRYVDVLRRFRNGVYHYQEDYFSPKVMAALMLGKDFDEWVNSLMLAFASISMHGAGARLPLWHNPNRDRLRASRYPFPLRSKYFGSIRVVPSPSKTFGKNSPQNGSKEERLNMFP
jgi:hypothetical protein